MTQMFKKLHNQRGASILVALMFFLVCAMVSAVILGSATTNAQKFQRQKESAQVYYSVSSAAKLLRDQVAKLSIDGSEVLTQYGCNDLIASQYASIEPAQEENTAQFGTMTAWMNGQQVSNDALIDLLSEGVQAVYKSKLQYADKTPFHAWSDSFTVENGKNTVDVTVSIDTDYSLTFQLSPHDEEWKDDYSEILTCAGKAPSVNETSDTSGSCEHTLTRDDLEAGVPITEKKSFETTIKTITTTISWEPGMIYKGAVSNE